MIPIRKSRILYDLNGKAVRSFSNAERRRMLKMVERAAFHAFRRRAERIMLYQLARSHGFGPLHARSFCRFIGGEYRTFWEREHAASIHADETPGAERTTLYRRFVPKIGGRKRTNGPTIKRAFARRQYHRDGFYTPDPDLCDRPEPVSVLVPEATRMARIDAIRRDLEARSCIVRAIVADSRTPERYLYKHAMIAWLGFYFDSISGWPGTPEQWTPVRRAERIRDLARVRRRVREIIGRGGLRTVRTLTADRRPADRAARLRAAPFPLLWPSYSDVLRQSGYTHTSGYRVDDPIVASRKGIETEKTLSYPMSLHPDRPDKI